MALYITCAEKEFPPFSGPLALIPVAKLCKYINYGASNRQYRTPSILKPASIFTLEYVIVDLKPTSVRATIKEKEFLVRNEDILRM